MQYITWACFRNENAFDMQSKSVAREYRRPEMTDVEYINRIHKHFGST